MNVRLHAHAPTSDDVVDRNHRRSRRFQKVRLTASGYLESHRGDTLLVEAALDDPVFWTAPATRPVPAPSMGLRSGRLNPKHEKPLEINPSFRNIDNPASWAFFGC